MDNFCFGSLFDLRIPAQCQKAKFLPFCNAHPVCYELDTGADSIDHFVRYSGTRKGVLPKCKITFSYFFEHTCTLLNYTSQIAFP